MQTISQVPSVTGSNLSTIAQRQAAKADLQAAKFELKFAEEEAELGKKKPPSSHRSRTEDCGGSQSSSCSSESQTTFEALKNCKEEVDNYQDVLERTKGYVWQQLERQ